MTDPCRGPVVVAIWSVGKEVRSRDHALTWKRWKPSLGKKKQQALLAAHTFYSINQIYLLIKSAFNPKLNSITITKQLFFYYSHSFFNQF